LEPRVDELVNPLEARERMVSFLENESGVEPLNETQRNENLSSERNPDQRNSYSKVRLEFNVSQDRIEATGARYVWEVGFYKLFPEDPSRDREGGGARITMDAVTGEVQDAAFRWDPVTEPEGGSGNLVPSVGMLVAPMAALAALACRRFRPR